MHDINLIKEIPVPRFLNDPEYFLVGVSSYVLIFSDGADAYAVNPNTEFFVCTDELQSSDVMRVYLARNYRFTADVSYGMVSPA